MRTDLWFDSCGAGKIHGCKWTPEDQPRAVVQIIHGIAEFAERYDAFACYLNSLGYVVVAEDHMGHGQSVKGGSIQGYFHGGWFNAVEDSVQLMRSTMAEYEGVPYILFGHSMGSFMARTILCKYPDSGIAGAIICGTGWQPAIALPAMRWFMNVLCGRPGADQPDPQLNAMIFGGYNKRIPDQRTTHDWLTRDTQIVDAYLADPLCGFVPTRSLLRDMVEGISYIQKNANLQQMRRDLPVFFIAGEEDPVGPYGKGVRQAADAFRKAGMKDVAVKLYPDCRHEILNELNRDEVFRDVSGWIESKI